MTGKKREMPLGLDLDFEEALERFTGFDPNELPDNAKLGKKWRAASKKPAAQPEPEDDENQSTGSGGDPPPD